MNKGMILLSQKQLQFYKVINFNKQNSYRGGYLFLQNIYYSLQLNKTFRKLKTKYNFKYDINAILPDLIYSRVLEPSSKRSSFNVASEFLEKPSYKLHDIYRALDVLGNEYDFIQDKNKIEAHFLIYFLALVVYRYLEKKLNAENKLLYTAKTQKTAKTLLFI